MLRYAETAEMALQKGPAHDDVGSIWLPWGVEQPLHREGKASGMNVKEMLNIKKNEAVGDSCFSRRVLVLNQSRILWSVALTELALLWAASIQRNGGEYRGRENGTMADIHRKKGKQKAIPWRQWRPWMLRRYHQREST